MGIDDRYRAAEDEAQLEYIIEWRESASAARKTNVKCTAGKLFFTSVCSGRCCSITSRGVENL